MILKKIFSKFNSEIDNSSNKKVLSKIIYGKFLVRSPLLESTPLYVLDNDSTFFNVSSFKLKKFVKLPEDLTGSSLLAKEFEYKNKLNKSLVIKNFIVKNDCSIKTTLIDSFYSTLQLSRKHYLSSLLILNPIKGGFICYSSGITGFMPRSHATFAFSNALKVFTKSSLKVESINNLSFLIDYQNKIKDFLVFRVANWWGKITLFPRIKKNRLSILSRRKKRFFSNNLNFVFLTKKTSIKNVKKNYENKKV